jgi:hypothetical protein
MTTTRGYVFDGYSADGRPRGFGRYPIRGTAHDADLPRGLGQVDPQRTNLPAPDEPDPNAVTVDGDDPRIMQVAEFLRDKLSDADRATAIEMLRRQFAAEKMGADLPPPFPGRPTPGGGKVPMNYRKDDTAMDYRTSYAADVAARSAVRAVAEFQEAQADVAPYVGHVVGDSAAAFYRRAIEARGHDARGLPDSACRAAWDVVRQRGTRAGGYTSPNSAAAKGFLERFPEARRIRQAF